MRNIILIGFMGCGKTTAGKIIAEKSGYTFVDTDEYIEKKYNMKISEIFEKYGEGKFREMETLALCEVCGKDNCIISTGGGIVERFTENAEIMKKSGTVFFINPPFEIIKQRLSGDTSRPLLAEGFEKAQKLYKSRLPKYKDAADVVVEKETSQETAEECIMHLNKGELI